MKYILLLLIPFFMACEDAIVLDAKKVSSIQYSFQDSSVPPRYHRSYSITVTPTQVHVTVDSYGDILADEEYDVTENQFKALVETINNAEISSGDVDSDPGCTGGTSENLAISQNDERIYFASIDNCGGTTIPKALGDYQTVRSEIKKLVPNLAELRK